MIETFASAFIDEIRKIAADGQPPKPAVKPPSPQKPVDPTKAPMPVMKPGTFFGTLRRGHVGA